MAIGFMLELNLAATFEWDQLPLHILGGRLVWMFMCMVCAWERERERDRKSVWKTTDLSSKVSSTVNNNDNDDERKKTENWTCCSNPH